MQPEPIPEDEPAPAPAAPAPRKTRVKKIKEPEAPPEPPAPKRISKRKSSQLAAQEEPSPPRPPPPQRTTRRTTRASLERIEKEQPKPTKVTKATNGDSTRGRRKKVPAETEAAVEEEEEVEAEQSTPMDVDKVAGPSNGSNSKKIALPFSDTPIINRNKEMRRKTGGRRSSLGMRGRRASSLIDNGHSAIPHRDVDAAEFYKHIEAEGPSEPRRMKQLLTWCGERALAKKPKLGSLNSNAILGGKNTYPLSHPSRRVDECILCLYPAEDLALLTSRAARAIQDQLLKDFSSKSEFSDWFAREDIPRRPAIVKPNPRNIEHDEKIAQLEERIKRLVFF